MEEIIVREMSKSDIPVVIRIEEECFSMPWSEKSFEESLSLPYAHFFVAEIEKTIVGYVGLYKMGDESDITNVAVSGPHRRKGVGRKLIDKVCRYAGDNGISSITLEVRESNSGAISLYENANFKNIGIRKNFYEKPVENAIIMVRDI